MRRVFKTAWRVALALLVVVFTYLSVVFVQVWLAARRDDARPSDAIIVLGAAEFDGRPSKILAARLDHAIDLYNRGIAPVVHQVPSARSCERRADGRRGSRSPRPRVS